MTGPAARTDAPTPDVVPTVADAAPAPEVEPALADAAPAPEREPAVTDAAPAPEVEPAVTDAAPAPEVEPAIATDAPAPDVAPAVTEDPVVSTGFSCRQRHGSAGRRRIRSSRPGSPAGGATARLATVAAPAPRRATAPARLAAAGVVVAGLGALGAVAAGGSPDGHAVEVLGPGRATVDLGIEHSRFGTDRIVVERGTSLTFVVDNGDPIGHELIVGPPEVHRRHAEGTEAAHPPVPGEVTVPALAVASTTYAFEEAGTFTYACHLPGHVAYGMVGEVVVVG